MGIQARVNTHCIVVELHGVVVGEVVVRGETSVFRFSEKYLESTSRPVMGLRFEEELDKRWTGQNRLPSWFSNLFPEGRLRQLLESALSFSESESRDMSGELKLVEALGQDLPGAVSLRLGEVSDGRSPNASEDGDDAIRDAVHTLPQALRFSVAGVGLKFSMLREGAQFVSPTKTSTGDWIVKFPDREFANLPRNEFAMMFLASRVGITVPEIMIVRRDDVEELGDAVWGEEREAFAIRRFDRVNGARIHIEDLAQVRGYYPAEKYVGTYETVANLFYRRRDLESLKEFTRRLVFSVLIGNSDAHLKNWSLIYSDQRVPSISPAYDLVSAAPYPPSRLTRDLALKFNGSKAQGSINLTSLARLETRLGVDKGSLTEVAEVTLQKTEECWKRDESPLDIFPEMREAVSRHIESARNNFVSRP